MNVRAEQPTVAPTNEEGSHLMKVALGQLQVSDDWRHNLDQIRELAGRAAGEGARLLLLPEGIIARDPSDQDLPRRAAQSLDGPFVTGLRGISATTGLALAGTVHVPVPSATVERDAVDGDDRPSTAGAKALNVHVVVDAGDLVAAYEKLHLYDAFTSRESDFVVPGNLVPPLVSIDGFRFGLMTCYDVRFPELARAHAHAGADALLIPAAWVRGPLKEEHWRVMVTARALENTVYAVAVGEVSARNIGRSIAVDPLGVTIAAATEQPGLAYAVLDRRRLDEARASLPVLANARFGLPALRPDPQVPSQKPLTGRLS